MCFSAVRYECSRLTAALTMSDPRCTPRHNSWMGVVTIGGTEKREGVKMNRSLWISFGHQCHQSPPLYEASVQKGKLWETPNPRDSNCRHVCYFILCSLQ
ncbi:unnamed protein product [Lasius platythorax]|uniref:Uncharacterized protein n=1 Tax=Lasius platythorax TaxID=488582 RepID=A0AAV2N2U4_9HYME